MLLPFDFRAWALLPRHDNSRGIRAVVVDRGGFYIGVLLQRQPRKEYVFGDAEKPRRVDKEYPFILRRPRGELSPSSWNKTHLKRAVGWRLHHDARETLDNQHFLILEQRAQRISKTGNRTHSG